jgi:poly-gamma-glutamate capsule biosynthesis protein CapA/YwtB (metallophosphatase superfamily)
MASVTIAAVGDLFPNDHFMVDGQPVSPGFSSTLALLAASDLRFATFLMPLSERGEPADKLANVRAHPDIAPDLAALRLDLVSLANNHSMDYGPLALFDTMAAFDAIRVRHIGAGQVLDDALAPVIFERGGFRVGVLAYSCLVPPGAAAMEQRAGIAPIRVYSSYEVNAQWAIEEPGEPEMVRIRTWTDALDQARAQDKIAALRNEVDILCASIHWGYGAAEDLAEYQRPLAHALVEAGADVVFGHHVHAVQGIEIYHGKPILYSPGNFVGRQIPEDPARLTELAERLIAAMSPDGYIALLSYDETGLSSLELVATSMDEHGLPLLATGEVMTRVYHRIARLSAKLGTKVDRREDRIVVQL